MTWIILAPLLLIVGIIAAMVARSFRGQKNSNNETHGAIIAGWIVAAACLIGFVVLTFVSSFNTVGQREVGIITEFGKITGQTGHGVVIVAPWANVETQSIAVTSYVVGPPKGSNEPCDSANGALTSFSKETQPVYICATLNWHVNNSDVQRLYKTVGPTFFDTIIPSRVNQAFKDETVKFKAVDVAPNREQIRLDVLDHLKNTLGKYSIKADDININDIEFSEQFQKAIDDKQVATQESLAAQNRVAKAQYEADQAVATADGQKRVAIKKAEGDAQAITINANAQAAANRKIAKSLTPSVIAYTYVQKLAPNVQAIVPNNGTILVPTNITGAATPAGGR